MSNSASAEPTGEEQTVSMSDSPIAAPAPPTTPPKESNSPIDRNQLTGHGGKSPHDEAVETVRSAQSSRSGSVFDETPPNIDVRVDDDDGDFDSAVGGMSRPASTFTADSGIFEFVEENGRTYHRYSDGKYILPNDEEELDRLDLQSHLWSLTLKDRLFIAPIDTEKNMQYVLDMGCGTGIWTINFADKYPQATIIGTDLSPVQPEWVPPNCKFEITDMEHPWTYSHPFDFIHGRMLFTCFTLESAKAIFTSAFNSLRPGGYLELQDCIFPQKCIDASNLNTSLSLWNTLCLEASQKMGRPWDSVQHWSKWLTEIGFEDVHEEVYLWPIGTWAKDQGLKQLGMWFKEDVLSVLPATGRLLKKGLGWEAEEVEVLLAGVRNDINSRKVHMFEEVRVMYGRKPFPPSV